MPEALIGNKVKSNAKDQHTNTNTNTIACSLTIHVTACPHARTNTAHTNFRRTVKLCPEVLHDTARDGEKSKTKLPKMSYIIHSLGNLPTYDKTRTKSATPKGKKNKNRRASLLTSKY